MVAHSPKSQSHTSAEAALEALGLVRARTTSLIAPVSEHDLERSRSPLMSRLVWDLGRALALNVQVDAGEETRTKISAK